MTHSVEYYAYKFLVQEEIASLPINYDQLLGYCKNEGYQVAFYEQEKAQKIIRLYNLEQYVETKSAFTISKPDIKIILVNNALALNERCFALAHELGHIVLQHTIRKSSVSPRTIKLWKTPKKKRPTPLPFIFLHRFVS